MKKIVIVIFLSFLFNAFLFGQEKNGVSELSWINKVETDAEKFYENGTRICYLNIYGEIPETYVQSIANQVLANSGVLRFHLYYGKEHSRCMCETKDDFTNEQLAIILDEIIDKYYESGTYLLDKEKFEQEQKMAEMKLSASSKTNVDEEMYLEDAAQKAEAMAIWERELQPSKLNAAKWEKGGIFEGYTPKDEIQSLRTQNSKKFRNPDGSITAQIGGNYHYADENNNWKDIDFTIKEESYGDFSFSNTTNTFKSYFPKTAGSQGFKMENKNVNINLWLNPEVLVTDNANGVVYKETANKNSKADLNANILKYNSFTGIVDELKLIDYGIENNIYINNINPAWNIENAKTISFKQSIKFNSEVEVLNSKLEKQVGDFEDELIAFKFASGEIVYLNNLIVFDNKTDKDEAKLYFALKKDNKLSDELSRKANSFYKGNYRIKFIDGGIEIYSDLDINWLKNAQLPVCVDPTWTIGSTATGIFYGPVTHWYGYQRHAQLYLQSEIGGYGTITQIEYYKTNTAATRTKPTKIYMRTTSLSSLSGQTSAWNSTTYTGGLTPLLNTSTTQDNTSGWKAFPLSSFTYNTNNLLVMVYDEYGGSGSSQYMAQQDVTSMTAYRRADSSDPGDASTMSIENKRHTIRITYSTCTPTTSSGSSYYITNFTTTGGTTNINNNSGSSTSGYQDFYNTVSMSATAGATINYSITCSSGTYGRAIWVDWNENGVFEASEQVASSSSYESSPLTGSFTIPSGTSIGTKRMRILASWTPSNPSNPCTNSGSGEYEDYKFIVIENPCDNITAMSCGVTYNATLYPNSGAWTNYTGASNSWPGSEKVWAFTAPTTGSYTFNLNEGSEDADFFLMSACSPSSTNLTNATYGYWDGIGDYTVTLTGGVTYYLIADLFSSSASTTVTVSVDCPPPPPTVSSNSPVCENSTLNLSTTMSGATSCNWSGPNGFTSTSSSPSISNVSLAAAGTYYVTVTASNGLTAGGSTTVTVAPNVTPTFNAVGPYCQGASIPALPTTSTNGITGTWSPAINNNATTTYTFTPNAGQCASTTTMQIVVNPLPSPSINPNPATICAGGSIQLTASGGATYNWSNSSTSPSINVSPASTTTYTVTVTSAEGCTASASRQVTVNPLPTVAATVDCGLGVGQGVINVTSPTGANYQYSLNGGSFQSSPSFGNLANGSYTVVATNTTTTCSSPESIVVVDCGCANPPTVTLATTSGEICGISSPFTLGGNTFGGSATAVTLSHNGGGNLNITSATSSPFSFTYTPAASDLGNTVTIIVTTNNPIGLPCTVEQKTLSLNVLTLPTVVVGYNPPVCETGTLILSETGGAAINWSWNGPNGFISTSQNPQINNATAAANGTYSVTVTDGNTCTNTGSVLVSISPNPVASATFAPIACNGGTTVVTVSASGGTGSYVGTGSFTVNAGTYYYTVTDANSCIDTTLVMITSPAPLEVSYVFENPSCKGARNGSIEIAVAGGVEPYLFETNNVIIDIPLFVGLSAGRYDVIITDANNCSFELDGIVLSESNKDCIRIPDAFTPNGDGINDTWIIENIKMFPSATIFVYNRWGQEVWVGNPGEEWDGKRNSKLMPAGTYLYLVELYDGSKPYTGTVTLVY